MKVLVLNSGSSSQKSALFDVGDQPAGNPPPPVWTATVDWQGEVASSVVRGPDGSPVKAQSPVESRRKVIEDVLATLWSREPRAVAGPSDIKVVGHRVVHGGPDHREPEVITPEVKRAIERVSAFAPLHNCAELEGMEIVEKVIGPVPQVAVFDTGFHRHMPEAAAVYPGPYDWLDRGIRRYGFHGINHHYCAARAAWLLGKGLNPLRLVTCHLGNGCSLAAIRHGHSVDTTMGFTPLDGLMMGTRSGAIDPGILTFLMRHDHFSGEQLDEILNRKSGLLGISGTSSDMRQILAARKAGDARARLAFEMFVHHIQRGIGSMVASIGGLDALIFSAGIGERSPEVRAAVCANLGFLGLALDPEKNAAVTSDEDISQPDSTARAFVIHAREDWAIARECRGLVAKLSA